MVEDIGKRRKGRIGRGYWEEEKNRRGKGIGKKSIV
jgi:hypothetical protein